MSYLAKVYRSYLEADGFYARAELGCSPSQRTSWAERRDINDKAYFVLMFSELEDRIAERVRKVIQRRSTTSSVLNQRVWKLLGRKEGNRGLPFMDKTSMLLERGNAEYNMVKSHYDVRCDIAHGKASSIGSISIPSAYSDFVGLVKSISRLRV